MKAKKISNELLYNESQIQINKQIFISHDNKISTIYLNFPQDSTAEKNIQIILSISKYVQYYEILKNKFFEKVF